MELRHINAQTYPLAFFFFDGSISAAQKAGINIIREDRLEETFSALFDRFHFRRVNAPHPGSGPAHAQDEVFQFQFCKGEVEPCRSLPCRGIENTCTVFFPRPLDNQIEI